MILMDVIIAKFTFNDENVWSFVNVTKLLRWNESFVKALKHLVVTSVLSSTLVYRRESFL